MKPRLGGGIVGLPGGTEDACEGGEENEGGEVEVLGELVEVDGGVELGAQDGVEPSGGTSGGIGTGGFAGAGAPTAGGAVVIATSNSTRRFASLSTSSLVCTASFRSPIDTEVIDAT